MNGMNVRAPVHCNVHHHHHHPLTERAEPTRPDERASKQARKLSLWLRAVPVEERTDDASIPVGLPDQPTKQTEKKELRKEGRKEWRTEKTS